MLYDQEPRQPLGLRRNSTWMPESRYWGDRYPRTMQEAFGPYATTLTTSSRKREIVRFIERHIDAIVGVTVGAIFVATAWLVL